MSLLNSAKLNIFSSSLASVSLECIWDMWQREFLVF